MDKQTQNELCSIVKRNYEEIAEHYGEARKKRLGAAWAELQKIAEETRPKDRVLDVGCGSGRLLQAIGDKEIRYLGVDACRRLVDLAKGEHPGFDFMVGDVLSLGDIKEIEFDHIFAIAVLHHIPGFDLRLKALRQMKNRIRPDGRIIITNWNLWSGQWQKKGFRRLIGKYALLKLIGKNKMDFGDILLDWKNPAGQAVSRRYYHALTKRELKKLAQKAGLEIIKLDKDKYNYYLVLSK